MTIYIEAQWDSDAEQIRLSANQGFGTQAYRVTRPVLDREAADAALRDFFLMYYRMDVEVVTPSDKHFQNDEMRNG